ncbi:MAG: immune inhibitor A [Dermatophilaceae bacterium]
MKRRHVGAVSGVAVAAVALALAPSSAQAGSSPAASPKDSSIKFRPGGDSLPNPLADAQAKLRQDAVAKLLSGQATLEGSGANRTIKIPGSTAPEARGTAAAKGRWVWYPTNREETIFSILTNFGSKTMAATGGSAGPMKNQIPKPDRNWDGSATDDNSTYWVDDFNRAHYLNMMFGKGESFKDFYLKQSQGRFLAKGDVSDWVTVPYNEARYGHNPVAGDGTSEADGYWNYVKDTGNSWYDAQKKAGKTDAQIKTYIKQFDKVDRYDYDGDGVYNEPDGYIDHFQAIHAGEGEEAGGGAQGEDAIWSHRWYAFSTDYGKTGPAFNKAGGTQIGNTGIWIGDYTTEPENGGLGVFTHEFGHDLGLRDYYDTADGTGMGNSTAFWTLMSSGSWLNKGGDSIGTTPGYMGPHEKLLLGWLDYDLVTYGQNRDVRVGIANKDGEQLPQAVAVLLPKRQHVEVYNTPYAGASEWWSGSGDNLQNAMSRSLDLTGASTASVSAMMWAEIEEGYDYLYAEASTDGGKNWNAVWSYTGVNPKWAPVTISLNAYAGKKIDFRFRYGTDGGLAEAGAFLDNIVVKKGSTTILTDGAENGDNGWTLNGFKRTTGTETVLSTNYYLAENRVYNGYDATLRTGPYNFGWSNTKPDWVERFPFQNGLLVWYVDNYYADNNTFAHPGSGFALPVDARPALMAIAGSPLTNRRSSYDATFGVEKTDAVTLHKNGIARTWPSVMGIRTFDDTNPNKYWSAGNPQNSVKVAGTGTKITVAKSNSSGWVLDLQVRTK